MTTDKAIAQRSAELRRIVLIPAGSVDLADPPRALLKGMAGFPSPRSGAGEVADAMAQFVRIPRSAMWGQFWAFDPRAEAVVGLCGCKAPPASGAIEIAYFTFPVFEGQGCATRMIAILVDMARIGAAKVVAHTLPEHNASNSALRRMGFGFDGPAIDSEDGDVWRWSFSLR